MFKGKKHKDPYPHEADKAFPPSPVLDARNLVTSASEAYAALMQGFALLCTTWVPLPGFMIEDVYVIRDGWLLELKVCGERNLELMRIMCASDEAYLSHVQDVIMPTHCGVYADRSGIVNISKAHYPAGEYPVDIDGLLRK